jgi:hypothetical protein
MHGTTPAVRSGHCPSWRRVACVASAEEVCAGGQMSTNDPAPI